MQMVVEPQSLEGGAIPQPSTPHPPGSWVPGSCPLALGGMQGSSTQPLSGLCPLSHQPQAKHSPRPYSTTPFSSFAPLILFLELGRVPGPQSQALV